ACRLRTAAADRDHRELRRARRHPARRRRARVHPPCSRRMSYLTDAPIDVAALIRRVLRPSDGAYVLFDGVVRNHHEGHAVESILYEAYRPMAEKEIDRIVMNTHDQYPDVEIAVQHRLGNLRVGDSSIAIVCASPHRPDAF